jgi:hypothetical protein
MAEAAKTNGIKNLFAKHGEKIGLGIAVVALLAYLVLGLPTSAEPAVEDAERAIRTIDKSKRSAHADDPDMKAPDTKPWFSRAKDPWDSVIPAKSGGDWVATATPELKAKELAKIEPKIKAVKIPTVAFGNVDIQLDSITVTWSVKGFTKQEMTKEAKDIDFLNLDHFTVEREVNGTGKWEMLAPSLPPTAVSFQDKKIDPKTKYTYRVTSYSEVDKSPHGRTPADGKHLVVKSGQIQSKGIWNLVFTNPSKLAGAEKGMVYVLIEKYEKGIGKVEKRHIHYAGDQIGWWPEGEGADPVSRHRIALPGGKTAEVDLDTKATLISVEPKKVTLDIKKCKPIYAKDGGKQGCETIVEKRVFDTHEIVFKDDEGEKKAYFPNPRDLPLGQDQMCEEHGGKKMVTQADLSKGPSPSATPDAPKEDPKMVAARKKEEEAEKLFNDATKSEAAKNKASAIAAYQRLLSAFADTDFVAKQKKSVIEERLSALTASKGK